eukprot:1159183-Pelagomonas_calceolata.AAC.33
MSGKKRGAKIQERHHVMHDGLSFRRWVHNVREVCSEPQSANEECLCVGLGAVIKDDGVGHASACVIRHKYSNKY